jgi:uncharacterized protein (TIGR02145 family)
MKTILLFIIAITTVILQARTQTVTDYDGHVYNTVVIGNQEWMKENLRVIHYQNGVLIPNVTVMQQWGNLHSGARCYYNNDSIANDSLYGALYNWYVISDTGKICPSGWHIPTHQEWTTLETLLGGWEIAGGHLKESGTLHWKAPNNEATNSTGFTGLPGGMRGLNHTFEYLGENGLWWTSTEYNSSTAWSRYQWYMQGVSDANPVPKNIGLSIRCVRDYPVKIDHSSTLPGIQIYPNPSRGKLTIDTGGKQQFTLTIYNDIGKSILQKELIGTVNEIETLNLGKGLYLVIISNKTITVQKKLIIE